MGVPLYNGVQRGHLREALDSLLAQTYPHVAFVCVDDCSSDGTPDLVASVAATDPRVFLERNGRRLGLVRNWCRAFRLGRELFPSAPYFAWGSDHDRWDCRWVERLVSELDEHPQAALAFPRYTRIDEHGLELKGSTGLRATDGLPRWERFNAACTRKTGAGKLVYGLYRADLLERAGVYPLVHQPDVYLIVELSLYGGIRVVRETLWHRREDRRRKPDARARPAAPAGPAEAGRRGGLARPLRLLARRSPGGRHRRLYPGRVPLYSRVPAWLQHAWLLLWRLVVLGRGRPALGRLEATRYAAWFFFVRLFGEADPKKARRRRRQQARDARPRHAPGAEG
jgi:hypothetical protein